MSYVVMLDAGHGGWDPGATYYGRQEKNDNLNLALAVGNILEQKGIPVIYTRTSDVYQTPFEKAEMANRSDADFVVSFHRNAMPVPGTASGIESLVYENTGAAAVLAKNINEELKETGFADLGIIERPGLVVLRRTRMPAVLIETGFIDNEADNRLYDQNFTAIAQAIADGIQKALEEEAAMKPEDPDRRLPEPGAGRPAVNPVKIPGIPGISGVRGWTLQGAGRRVSESGLRGGYGEETAGVWV